MIHIHNSDLIPSTIQIHSLVLAIHRRHRHERIHTVTQNKGGIHYVYNCPERLHAQ